jgi:hypothetical protein
MRRTASKPPTTPIEIAKLRSTVDEGPRDPDDGVCVPNEAPCVPEEELGEDDDVVPDVVPVLLLVCDVEDIVDEVSEGSRTSKLNHIESIFSRFPKGEQLT